jgi:glycosyl transferase family 87
VTLGRLPGVRDGAGSNRLRALRDGAIVAGLLFNLAIFVVGGPFRQTLGADAYAYWSLNVDHPYVDPMGSLGAFLYSPVAVRAFAPVSLVSWPVFWWLWTAALVATVIWLGGRRTLWLLAFPPVAVELYYGNINLLIATAIALGFRYPWAWAFVLLTKLTPGVGLVWFAVRREWRKLGIALGATLGLVLVSVVIDGSLWTDWLTLLTQSAPTPAQAFGVSVGVRIPIAAVIVGWGARTDRRWTVPVGAMVAVPALWLASLSILAAIPALSRPELRDRAA